MTEFCANFYIISNFLIILNPFPNLFYNSGQQLDTEKN